MDNFIPEKEFDEIVDNYQDKSSWRHSNNSLIQNLKRPGIQIFAI